MDNKFSIQGRGGYVSIKMEGDVARDDIESAFNALTKNQEFVFSHRLWDLRSCNFSMAISELDEIAGMAQHRDKNGSRVAILTEAELADSLIRIYSGLRSSAGSQVRVFHQFKEAVAWLDST